MDSGSRTEAGVAPAAGSCGCEVTVKLDGCTRTLACAAGATLLDAIRAAGLQSPASCEAGQCGTCMAALVDGAVSLRARTALSDQDLADGMILTCQAVPTTARCSVDFDAV